MDKYKDILDKVADMKVTELAELVKAMEEKFGVSAAMPVMAAGAGAAAGGEAAEEKTAFNVLLKDAGGQKIQVIKALREALGLGLQEAKALTDAAPKVVKEGLKKEEAEELKKKLTDAGATAELQ
ncbi:MAG: 50S ribosomal protein L7/L12 [bacterium]|nr:50S ribosomal protein L7/L12 [bacterium]